MAEDEGLEEKIIPRIEKDHSGYFIGWGIALSLAWVVIVIVLINVYDLAGVDNWNQLGDFLAGTTAPIALIWFVLGFFLQIKEIRYQRIEINKLGGFTERQAHATEKQVALGEKELNKIKEGVKPKLLYSNFNSEIVSTGDFSDSRLTFNFKNIGGTAHIFKVTTTSKISNLIFPDSPLDKNQGQIIRFQVSEGSDLRIPIELSYFDLDNNEYLHKGYLGNDEVKNRNFFSEQKLIGKKNK